MGKGSEKDAEGHGAGFQLTYERATKKRKWFLPMMPHLLIATGFKVFTV
jgi:hypothetical protein